MGDYALGTRGSLLVPQQTKIVNRISPKHWMMNISHINLPVLYKGELSDSVHNRDDLAKMVMPN